jgi:hypothetical protein
MSFYGLVSFVALFRCLPAVSFHAFSYYVLQKINHDHVIYDAILTAELSDKTENNHEW